ncbi:MAG: type VI secretion system tip protein TssI/VgrG [Gemmataceae bacterium]
MQKYSQSGRAMKITTPLGTDAVLLAGLRGREALSEPFHFRLHLLAEKPLEFDRLLGQGVTVRLEGQEGSPGRFFHGLITRLARRGWHAAARGTRLLAYEADLRPRLWLLGRRQQSRVFEQKSPVDIVLGILRDEWSLDVRSLLAGTYGRRDYCVQYAESDLAFVSRLMEEMGIWYFFEHTAEQHRLVLGDRSEAHPDLAGGVLLFEDESEGRHRPNRITAWTTEQEITSGKVTLRDRWFEVPDSNLEAIHTVAETARVGGVEHRLTRSQQFRGQELLERYEFPGGYAWHYDGVTPNGGEDPARLQEVFRESQRLAGVRAEELACAAIHIDGAGDCTHLTAGARFQLVDHFEGDGEYVLTAVEHEAELRGAYLTHQEGEEFSYRNQLRALPITVPFRPARVTPRPEIPGPQTAMVVGPPGQDIFVDKYGRVKVKFFWDRSKDSGPECSCWLRVAQVWAGNRWGAFFWPRVGHEVVVSFLNGDPDRPLVTGSVYNANNMPPFELPLEKNLAGIKSHTASGTPNAPADPLSNYNGVVFFDQKDGEHLELHGERYVYFNSEEYQQNNVNGPLRYNVSDTLSWHVGSLPGGSGSGGGGKEPTPQVKFEKGIWKNGFGAVFASITGVESKSLIGLNYSTLMGDKIETIINPMIAFTELGGASVKVPPPLGAACGAMGALFGKTDYMIGNRTEIIYGFKAGITRSVYSEIKDYSSPGKVSKLELAMTALAGSAMGTGMMTGALTSYDMKQSWWLGFFASGATLALATSEVILYLLIKKQLAEAKKKATAAVVGQQPNAVQDQGNAIANNVVPNPNLDGQHVQQENNGVVIQQNHALIQGNDENALMFVGLNAGQQSVLAMEEDSIVLANGMPSVGPRMLFDSRNNRIIIGVGPPNLGSFIQMDLNTINLSLGPTRRIRITQEGIEFTDGVNKWVMLPSGVKTSALMIEDEAQTTRKTKTPLMIEDVSATKKSNIGLELDN